MIQYVTAALVAATRAGLPADVQGLIVHGDERAKVPAGIINKMVSAVIDDQVRYFIGSDDSGHKYAVPVHRRADWEAWVEDPVDDVPDWAIRFEGNFTFTDPRA